MHRYSILLIALLALGVNGCSDNRMPVEVSDPGEGSSVSFAIRLSKLAAATMARAEIVITAADMVEIRQDLTIDGDTVSGTVQGIPAGSGRLFTLNGYGADGSLLYSGSVQVDMAAGEVVPVYIAMHPTPTDLDPEIILTTSASTLHNMLLVPEGEFTMGSTDGESDEKPKHTVFLDAFYIDRYEVTVQQWNAFAEENNKTQSTDSENWPVRNVTWTDARDYCEWAGMRLPTEAEWEKAARGTDERTYPWGDWDASKASRYYYAGSPDPVGSGTGVSPYGVYDMAGNVWEWVSDWYESAYYSRSPERNPSGPAIGIDRVRRGGGYYAANGEDLRTTNRDRLAPEEKVSTTGFRCVKNP